MADVAEALGKGKATKPKVHTMHIHAKKGGYHVHHFHQPHQEGMKPDATHVVPHGPAGEGDLDNLHAHLEHHLGAPNAGESELAPGVVPEAPAEGAAPPAMANLAPSVPPAPAA
jgi:hypothetical protein